MDVPSKTIEKMQSLSADKMTLVVNLVDQLAQEAPLDVFFALCEDGGKNPMTEAEVAEFVSDVRKERNASCR